MATRVDNTNVLYEINAAAKTFYQNYLHSQTPKAAWQYLCSREIKWDAIWTFSIGASSGQSDDLYQYLRNEGFYESDLLASGLISKSRTGRFYDRFQNRIMFPICNMTGQVIGFTGRLYEETDGHATYMISPETAIFKKQDNLYGLNIAGQWCRDTLILVEGIIDVIILNQAGFCNVAAPLGVELKEEQMKLISQFTNELILSFDGDRVGAVATRKALDMAANVGLKVRAVTMPDGTDPMEFVQSHGAHGFFRLLSSAQTPLAYALFAVEKAHPITNSESLICYLQTAALLLAQKASALEVDVFTDAIAKKYGISKDVMLSEIRRYQHKVNRERE